MLRFNQKLNLLQIFHEPSVEGQISLRLRCTPLGSGRTWRGVGVLWMQDGEVWKVIGAGRDGTLYTIFMRPICFLSDFGLADDFAGTCKGVMLRIAPGVSIVDLTHEIPGFGVEAEAEIPQHATRYMPADTVYLAVVDPGVGTERRELALRTESGALLVGPDNGLLVSAAESLGGILDARDLIEERFHLHPVSNTFHGRDVFAPVAAHLAAGVGLSDLGEPVDPTSMVHLDPASAPGGEGEGF